jgi:hypothetical protein
MQRSASVLQIIVGSLLCIHTVVNIQSVVISFGIEVFVMFILLSWLLVVSGKEVFFYVEKHYKPLPEKNLKMMFDEAKKA